MIERLLEKIHSLRSERGAGSRHVSMGCNDYERQGYSAFSQFLLKLNTALPWQSHIRYDTARPVFRPGGEKRFCVGENTMRVDMTKCGSLDLETQAVKSDSCVCGNCSED